MKKLTLEQIALIKKVSPPQVFKAYEDLVYEGQIPQAGYILLSGKVIIEKNKKYTGELPLYNLIGIKELINNIPLEYTLKIQPNSKVIVLSKTSLFELLESPDLNLIFKQA